MALPKMDRDVVSRLVYSMIQFLRNELETASSSTLSEGAESLEVALQCLETAYGISQDSSHLSVSKSLYEIFDEATKDECMQTQASNCNSEPTTEDKMEAERLKNDGNQLMREDNFEKALESYTKAITKDKTNAVYYCNRAAAHSKLNNHLEAIEDCKRALRIEPNYSKAYGRMGLAYAGLGRAQDAKEWYQKALEVEPDNESYRGNLQIAEEKLRSQQSQQPSTGGANPANPFAALAGGSGGFNLGALGSLAGLSSGNSGGEPDIQGLFNNPTLMNLATHIMTDPNMQNMMASFFGSVSGAGNSSPTAPPPQQPPPPTRTEESSGLPPSSGPAAPGGPQGMEALLTAGRQLAEQMQAEHPELVEQLRSQMNRPSWNTSQGGNQSNQDPPGPPQT